jgi:hypothetical protein
MVDLTADRVRREVGKVDILINNVRHVDLLFLLLNVFHALMLTSLARFFYKLPGWHRIGQRDLGFDAARH